MINYLIKYCFDQTISGKLSDIFISKPTDLKNFSSKDLDLLLWGDPIIEPEALRLLNNEDGKVDCRWLIENIGGHFYYILKNKNTEVISIGNSAFAILPVYFKILAKEIYISNSPVIIADHHKTNTISKRFILENILFNYQLFNNSCFDEIKLLPTHNCIVLDQKEAVLDEVISIEDYFVEKPKKWQSSVKEISELFIQRVKCYLPEQFYISALTGGFDGRTLVASSLFYNKKFSTYSFGNNLADDVNIARKLSRLAGLDYECIKLDNEYVKQHSLKNGLEFIEGCAGGSSFNRAHYLYAIKQLKNKTNFLITGNFGSEIFRAAHLEGAVISPNLHKILSAKNVEEAIDKVNRSSEWNVLNRNEFLKEWDELKEDIKTLPCFNEKHNKLSKNQQFYVIVFNDIFRKYFGAEMVNQYNYLINRTPFLDFKFIKELLKTELAGVYSDLFTRNPFKRFKGQITYAQILNKTYPLYGAEMTDKGYTPDSLLSFSGKANIGFSFIKKKIKPTVALTDVYSVKASYDHNQPFFESLKINSSLFNKDFIVKNLNVSSDKRQFYFMALAQIYWNNYLLNRV